MDPQISKIFGNRLRVRICGICWEKDNLLMVNHKGLTKGDFWAPPGGGVEYGQDLKAALKKEFQEETGLGIRVGNFLFATELIQIPLHALELFFEVFIEKGELKCGFDPELPDNQQIIKEVKFVDPESWGQISPEEKHGVFKFCNELGDLKRLSGFFEI